MVVPPSQHTNPVQTSGSYRAWTLSAGLDHAADLAWYSRSDGTSKDHHRLLPFTEPSVALRRQLNKRGETRDWDFVIFPAQPDGGAYEPGRSEEIFALRLAPEAMEPLLGMSARDHLGTDAGLPSALADRFDPVARLADEGDFVSAWRMMSRLLGETRCDAEPDPIWLAAGIARRSRGFVGPQALAERVGLSLRHMRRGFSDRLGLSPRAVLRRQRLTAVMVEAERHSKPDWAGLAASFGFSDQAHMIRECRSLTGRRPGEWHTQRHAMAVSFNT